MDSRMFDGIGNLIITLCVLCIVFVPLGLWKAIEIIIWLYHHLSIDIK